MRIALALSLALASVAPALQAQTPAPATPVVGNTTAGAVMRVTLLKIRDGQNNAFWDDVRRHGKPIFDEEKKQGMILDYQYYTKSTTDGPDDWDVGITVTYPNWAAFDTFGARMAPLTLAHYGTADARSAAGTARGNYSQIAQSFLIRQQTPNPIAK